MENLIIFFAGWGMDENPFKHIDKRGFDIVTLYDYTDVNLTSVKDSLLERVTKYNNIYIVAWSMGVWVANKFIQENINKLNNLYSFTAINGTFHPIHGEFGISPIIYDKTLNNLPKGLDSFNLRMCGGRDILSFYNSVKPQRADESIIQELINIKDGYINSINYESLDSNVRLNVIISKRDNIIPTANQLNFWNSYSGECNIVELDLPHYPFYKLENWHDIINGGEVYV